KQVLAVLGQGHVHVHTGTVVTDQRLGHEGGGLAISVSHVVNAVLQDLNFVGLGGQGVGANTDFALAGGAHFVVVHFDCQAHLLHGGAHGGAQVVQGIHRRYREVAAFHTRTVTDVVLLELIGGHPGRFFGVDVVHGAGHVGLPLYGIKHEEFRLRTKQGAVGDAGGLQVFLGALSHGAGIALVALHGGGLDDGAT